MTTNNLVCVNVFGVLLTTWALVASAGWEPASNGAIPVGSMVVGHESNGSQLYACRANHQGGMHPGKVRPEFGACNIGWGGQEVAIKHYETFVQWKPDAHGGVPSAAVVGGHESNGAEIYICRGHYNGGLHAGKLRAAFRGCNIGWGGREVVVNPYEVLIQ